MRWESNGDTVAQLEGQLADIAERLHELADALDTVRVEALWPTLIEASREK